LLVFQTPHLPAPLWLLSPWLDWLVTPRDEVFARLAAQQHRRVIKTHTPLDGLPLDDRATYVVATRHPLDAAVSLYHQGGNVDRERLGILTGASPPTGTPPRPPLAEWLQAWIDADPSPAEQLDSLPGVMWHLNDAWARRGDANVVLVHYDDLAADLGAEMRRLARRLGITVADELWPLLTAAAGFGAMRSKADELVPDPVGVLKDHQRFFRRGSSGAAAEALGRDDWARYGERVRRLAVPELLPWLHRDASTLDGRRSRWGT
jgi:hypothetical protein